MNLLIKFFGTTLLIFIGFSGFLLLIFHIIIILQKHTSKQIDKNKYVEYGFTQKEFLAMKQQLETSWSQKHNHSLTVDDNDVYWALCNDKIIKSYSTGDLNSRKSTEEIQLAILKMENKIQSDENIFTEEYLNTKLEDGMTIKERMDEDFGWQLYLSSKQSKIDFPKNVDEQYKHIIYTLESYNDKYPSPTPEEEFLLKTFLQKVALVRKNFHIYAKRWCDGTLCLYYNNKKIGTVNLRSKNYSMDVYRGETNLKSYSKISFNDCLKNIDAWIRYCKYHVKN